MDISKKLFKRLDHYFKDKKISIKFSFVASYNVLFVTNNDRVYRFNELKNTYSSIAYSSDEADIKSMIENAIVNELSKKGVIDFKNGLLHTIARTIDGKVYVWGRNSEGLIGNGLENVDFLCEPKLNEHLEEFNIIDICCGTYHSLALTSSGDIYAWGANKYGQIGIGSDRDCEPTPKKMKYSKNEKFKAISCGCYHSMALTKEGQVFACGYNEYGQ
jgi:alpha-tubulin suppressor-like RCC1 family protein